MSIDLEEAIRLFDMSEAEEQKANELPWFNELPSQVRQKAKGPPEGRQRLPQRR
jgi:hypothetical protein